MKRRELKPQVELAWQVYSRAQDAWRKGINAESAPDGEKRERRAWLAQCKQAAEEKAAAQAANLLSICDLD